MRTAVGSGVRGGDRMSGAPLAAQHDANGVCSAASAGSVPAASCNSRVRRDAPRAAAGRQASAAPDASDACPRPCSNGWIQSKASHRRKLVSPASALTHAARLSLLKNLTESQPRSEGAAAGRRRGTLPGARQAASPISCRVANRAVGLPPLAVPPSTVSSPALTYPPRRFMYSASLDRSGIGPDGRAPRRARR
eukprot:356451-Chlamydomonas_euryale.AAC.4